MCLCSIHRFRLVVTRGKQSFLREVIPYRKFFKLWPENTCLSLLKSPKVLYIPCFVLMYHVIIHNLIKSCPRWNWNKKQFFWLYLFQGITYHFFPKFILMCQSSTGANYELDFLIFSSIQSKKVFLNPIKFFQSHCHMLRYQKQIVQRSKLLNEKGDINIYDMK